MGCCCGKENSQDSEVSGTQGTAKNGAADVPTLQKSTPVTPDTPAYNKTSMLSPADSQSASNGTGATASGTGGLARTSVPKTRTVRPYVPLAERQTNGQVPPSNGTGTNAKSVVVLTHFSAFDNYAVSTKSAAERFLAALTKEERSAASKPSRPPGQSGGTEMSTAARLAVGTASHEEATRVAQLNQVSHAGGPLDPESGELQDEATLRAWISGLRSYAALCSVLCDKYAERLPRMPSSVATPMSAYLSAVSRHGYLAKELQQALMRCVTL